jgi:hypothetical protein
VKHAIGAEPTFDEEMPEALRHVLAAWQRRRVSVGDFFLTTYDRR